MKSLMPILLVLFSTSPLFAHGLSINLPEHDWSIGPGIAYSKIEGEHGFALNLDTAYTYFLFSASANLKLVHHKDLTAFMPQLELSAWVTVQDLLEASRLSPFGLRLLHRADAHDQEVAPLRPSSPPCQTGRSAMHGGAGFGCLNGYAPGSF